ncbi:MAG: methyltransferase domain-containing protein [Planctomycetota bacterium]|jgi:SAM-dependent methyltransferase
MSLSRSDRTKNLCIKLLHHIKQRGFLSFLCTVIRKTYEAIIHPQAKGFKQLRELIIAQKGLEVGGPSRVFSKSGLMPIYEIAGRVDNCNFGQKTIWEGVLEEGENFRYGRGAVLGHQYIREATDLHGIPSEEYDFVCSADVIEHVANPLLALFEWTRVLKHDGIMILVVPHKERTFDHKRPLTLLDHLIEDQTRGTTEDDTTHIGEVLELHDLSMDPLSGSFEEFKERTLNNFQNRAVHQHVFDVDLVINMLNYAGIHNCNIEVCRPHSIVAIGHKLLNRQEIDNSTLLNESSKI